MFRSICRRQWMISNLNVRLYGKSASQFDLKELADQLPDSPLRQRDEAEVDALDWSHLKDEDSQGKSESDAFSAGESGRTEQKEEMIFKEVLSHVLSTPARPQKHEVRKPNTAARTSTPLADSILALFDKTNDRGEQNASTKGSGVTSLMDDLLHPRREPTLSPEEIKRREAVSKRLALVFEHIEQLNTNRDVIAYFESVILPRFDPAAKIDVEGTVEPDSPDQVLIGPDTASALLEKCIAVLADDFKDPLGALHIFELSKHHSIDFFTEACSAEVYNQMIRIRWYGYRDLYAVVNLAAEIAINAIPPTLETTELLSSIYREAYDSSKGMGTTPYGMPLWTGQDVRRLEELNRYRSRFQTSWAAKPVLRF